jgi:tetratricopeptide (TPR) repeat protein
MKNTACERWGELADRVALGDVLTADESRFEAVHVAECAACAAEARVWAELGSVLPDSAELPRTVDAGGVQRRAVPHPGRAQYGILAAVAAAVAAVAVGGIWHAERRVDAPVRTKTDRAAPVNLVLVSGEVQVHGIQAAAGASLGPNDSVRIGRGRACLAYPQGISACSGDGSELKLRADENGNVRLALAAGSVLCRLEPQPSGTHFSVETARGRVSAKGTVFAVEQLTRTEFAVRAHQGAIEIETNGGEHRLLRAPAAAILGEAIREAPPGGEAWQVEARLSEFARLWGAGAAAPVDIATVPSGARVIVDGIDLGEAPMSTLLGRGEHETVAVYPGLQTARERFVVKGAERVSQTLELQPVPAAPAQAARPAATPGAGRARPSASALLGRARSLRVAGRYREAAAAYQELVSAYAGSDVSRVALVSLGELQLSSLGRPAAALESFERYLAGGGSLTQEARYGRIRALTAVGRTQAAREATDRFLRDYPGSAQAESLRHGSERR